MSCSRGPGLRVFFLCPAPQIRARIGKVHLSPQPSRRSAFCSQAAPALQLLQETKIERLVSPLPPSRRIKFRSHRRLYMPKIKQKTNNPPPRPPAALHTSLFPCTEFQLRGPHQEFACRHHLPICPWDPWLPSWPVKHLQSRPVESANISMPACPGENAETDSELGLEANRLLPGPILQPA
ncbi:uncharacterized protein ACBT57_003098 isoform 1-T1 [Dama dama]